MSRARKCPCNYVYDESVQTCPNCGRASFWSTRGEWRPREGCEHRWCPSTVTAGVRFCTRCGSVARDCELMPSDLCGDFCDRPHGRWPIWCWDHETLGFDPPNSAVCAEVP